MMRSDHEIVSPTVGRWRETADGRRARAGQRRVPKVYTTTVRKYGRHWILFRSGSSIVILSVKCQICLPSRVFVNKWSHWGDGVKHFVTTSFYYHNGWRWSNVFLNSQNHVTSFMDDPLIAFEDVPKQLFDPSSNPSCSVWSKPTY